VCMALSHMVAGACGVRVRQAIAGGHTPAKCCAPQLPRQFGEGNMLLLQMISFPKP
jgi:hypothetical protein